MKGVGVRPKILQCSRFFLPRRVAVASGRTGDAVQKPRARLSGTNQLHEPFPAATEAKE